MTATASRQGRPQSDVDLGKYNLNPQGRGLIQLLQEDLTTHEGEWTSAGFLALAVHRFGNWRMSVRPKLLRAPFSLLYRLLAGLIRSFCGIDLPYTVQLGRRVRIWHRGGMTISAIRIGDDVHIRQNVTLGVARRGDHRWLRPVIGDRCDLGAGAVIVGGITVGEDSVIGANVVLSESVPPCSIVTVPKPVVRRRQHAHE
jgi:serine O-acetyltransferase